MDRSRVIAVVAGGFLAVLLVAVATADPVRVADRAPTLPFGVPEFELSTVTTPTTEPAPLNQDEQVTETGSETLEWLTLVIEIVLFAFLFVATVVLLKRAWEKRPALSWSKRTPRTEFVVLSDVAEAVVADADAQFAALRGGRPRNAIVECWLRLETLVEQSGFERNDADTTAEFTTKVLTEFELDVAAVERLAGLYREARFSTHELGEDHRRSALAALGEIHDGIGRRSVTPTSGTTVQ